MHVKTLVILSAALLFVGGCGSNKSKNPTPNTTQDIIIIDGDHTFTNPIVNRTYVIRGNNAVIDLGGLTHTYDDAYQAFRIIGKNVTIKNGTLVGKGKTTGIVFGSCIRPHHFAKIAERPDEAREEMWAECTTGGTMAGVTLKGMKDAVYVGNYVNGLIIERNTITDSDAVGIYVDSGAGNNTIRFNTFSLNGMRNYSGGGRLREDIALDGAHKTLIHDNVFDNKGAGKRVYQKNSIELRHYQIPAISAYNNCGEPTFNGVPLPRVHGSTENVIRNNVFQNMKLAVWLQFREHHNIHSSCVKPYFADRATNNGIKDNTFLNVNDKVIDNGADNTVTF